MYLDADSFFAIPCLLIAFCRVFTLVIMAWASIYATAAHGKRALNPFHRFLLPFSIGNGLVSITLFGIFFFFFAHS